MSRLISPSEALARLEDVAPPEEVLSQTSESVSEYFALELAGMGLLLAADMSCELVDTKNICPLPGSPPWLLGVLSVRGFVVPIFDLRSYLAPEEEKKSLLKFAIINLNGSRSWGIALEKMPEKKRFNTTEKNETELPASIREFVSDSYMQDLLWCEFNWHQLFSRLAA